MGKAETLGARGLEGGRKAGTESARADSEGQPWGPGRGGAGCSPREGCRGVAASLLHLIRRNSAKQKYRCLKGKNKEK